MDVNFSSRINLSQGLLRQSSKSFVCHYELGLVSLAPSESEASRSQSQLHVVPRWFELLFVYLADGYGYFLDVFLSSDGDKCLGRYSDSADFGDVWFDGPQHASMGRTFDGFDDLSSHVACFLSWRLQASSRVQLGDRRCAFGAHFALVLHWISVAVGSTRAVGRDRWNQHDGLLASDRKPSQIRVVGRRRDWFRNSLALVCIARFIVPIYYRDFYGRAFLACPQRWRYLGTSMRELMTR